MIEILWTCFVGFVGGCVFKPRIVALTKGSEFGRFVRAAVGGAFVWCFLLVILVIAFSELMGLMGAYLGHCDSVMCDSDYCLRLT